MGVFFAIQSRNWIGLLKERALRILLPFVFGMFAIVPIHIYLWKSYNHLNTAYTSDPGHLWFLANIFLYVVIFSPVFFYLKKSSAGGVATTIRKIFSTPLGLVLVIGCFIAEAMILKPYPYELYVMTGHGFVLGTLAFFFGFCFVLSGENFWKMLVWWRWLFLGVAIGLYVLRALYFKINVPYYLLVAESQCWIFSVLAFANQYLNRPSKALTYLSQAAYPVYILHMIFLYLASAFIFPLNLPVAGQYILVVISTIVGCFGVYEIIRRIKFIRPLLGLKW
jgi:hypothetical protein